MKDLCQKMEGKTNFSRRLSVTGIVECLEITDVGCNPKLSDSWTWLTLTPRFYDRSTPLSEAEKLGDCKLRRWV